MATLTKADLAQRLFDEVGLSKREAKSFVEEFFHKISDSLEKGMTVKLSGLGNFVVRDKRRRPGRNPKTGESVPVSARRVVTFKSNRKLKNFIESLSRKQTEIEYE